MSSSGISSLRGLGILIGDFSPWRRLEESLDRGVEDEVGDWFLLFLGSSSLPPEPKEKKS